MIFGSRKVNELYQRYCRQVLKILRSPSYDLTGEECREIWDEIWKEAMRRNRELRKLKNEEETSKQQMTRTRWIKEGEDPMDLLNVEDITRGITSRKDDDDDDDDNEV